MTDLKGLMRAAKLAAPGDRIDFRDSIAAHGALAVEPMKEWLENPALGAFAVRVLAKIAERGAHGQLALDALLSVDYAKLPASVTRDAREAAAQIGGAPSSGTLRTGPSPGATAEPWPGARVVSALELRFHDAMLDVFTLAGAATRRVRTDGSVARGYWASRFLQAVRRRGGPDYARQLMRAKGTTEGFKRLAEEDRLDLTVEALVLRPEFKDLFTDADRMEAARRIGGRKFA